MRVEGLSRGVSVVQCPLLIDQVINKIIMKIKSRISANPYSAYLFKRPFLQVFNSSQDGRGKSLNGFLSYDLYPVNNVDIKLLGSSLLKVYKRSGKIL
jgi:hypothetical protein